MKDTKTLQTLISVLFFTLVTAATLDAQEDCRGLSLDLVRLGFVPNRIIIKPWNANTFRSLIADDHGSFTTKPLVFREIATTGAFTVDSPSATTAELLDIFGRRKDLFQYVEKDAAFAGHKAVEPNDEEFKPPPAFMWGLRAIHAPEAWEYGQGSDTIVAAVVDSGIHRAHDDLVDNVFTVAPAGLQLTVSGVTVRCRAGDFGYDAIKGNCLPNERNVHGTQVSGVLGARGNNKKGVVGVNWVVTILPVAFLDENNVGCASRAAKGLEFIHRAKSAGTNVRVANLSWGGHQYSRLVEDELVKLAAADIVVVASAGNEGASIDQCPMYPAGYSNVSTLIAVAATDDTGAIAGLSNHSNTSVHIAAPGIRIRTTDPDLFVDDASGTSMAAPFVSGAVALIASQCASLTAIELKELILTSADQKSGLADHVVDGRFLNLYKAAKACADSKTPPRRERRGTVN
jgi:subtilisin family serine protease